MTSENNLPDYVILYRSHHPFQSQLKEHLISFGITVLEVQYLAEMADLSFLEKSSCAIAIIDDDLKGIEFLRSVMHYHPWTQRIMLTDSVNIHTFEQAINKAHVNYLLHFPLGEKSLKTYLIKANRRFRNLIRPLNKLNALSNVTTDLLQENERMRLESQTDSLTRLLNRRSMNTIIDNLWHQFITLKTIFSFAILDIDHFKKVNDRYGHEVGDQVLRALSNLLIKNLRKEQDFAFRYGGEEFALISTHSGGEKMYLYVKRLLKLTRKMVVSGKDYDVKITFSAGVSDTQKITSPQQIIHQADIALYQAKNSGRNRVVLFKK